ESEYSHLLETYKFELRKSEEALKADLKAKEVEISALRSGTLSAISNRQLLLDKKRIEASEEIWASVVALGAFKIISSWMAGIKFEEAAEAAKHDPKVRKIVEVFDKQIDPDYLKSQLAPSKSRPFVTPMLWASYSAYNTILMQAVMQAFVIKSGVGPGLLNEKRSAEILKLVLPHQSEYIDQFGSSCYHHLLEEIEEKILKEIHNTISGESTDEAGIRQAAAVINKCNEFIKPKPDA
ncbi:hypothetical protein Q9L58_010692, partial [Maublancomyces gigas]